MTQALTAEEIFAADDLGSVTVDVPEWPKDGRPGQVTLRMMTAEESVEFAMRDKESEKRDGIAPGIRLISLCAVDENGDILFTAEDLKKLSKKSMKAISRLQSAAIELNGLSEKAVVEAKKS